MQVSVGPLVVIIAKPSSFSTFEAIKIYSFYFQYPKLRIWLIWAFDFMAHSQSLDISFNISLSM